jgi:hypothetical protein
MEIKVSTWDPKENASPQSSRSPQSYTERFNPEQPSQNIGKRFSGVNLGPKAKCFTPEFTESTE